MTIPASAMLGKRYGMLLVTVRGAHTKKGYKWLCRCDCGADTEVNGSHLRAGTVVSCGCLHAIRIAESNRRRAKHGQAREGGMREYRTWAGMRARCMQPNNPAFSEYGGRGIKVCAAWDTFAQFFADMGPRPSPKHSLDRIDVDGDYSPNNCRWATWDVQTHNRRGMSNTGVRGITKYFNKYRWAVARDGVRLRGSESALDVAIAALAQATRELYGAEA